MKRTLIYLILAIALHALIWYLIYWYTQYDAKGLAFFIITFYYLTLHTIAAIAILLSRLSAGTFVHSFVVSGLSIYIYLSSESIRYLMSTFDFNLWHFIAFAGSILFAVLLTRLIIHLKTISAKEKLSV
jgi:hypothetical protein